ncbi:hypothetical protein EDD11_001080 [Mortierella claussenii]|nr:hypothetical protein EDD11_001080 [Mortierella claussenii]
MDRLNNAAHQANQGANYVADQAGRVSDMARNAAGKPQSSNQQTGQTGQNNQWSSINQPSGQQQQRGQTGNNQQQDQGCQNCVNDRTLVK